MCKSICLVGAHAPRYIFGLAYITVAKYNCDRFTVAFFIALNFARLPSCVISYPLQAKGMLLKNVSRCEILINQCISMQV